RLTASGAPAGTAGGFGGAAGGDDGGGAGAGLAGAAGAGDGAGAAGGGAVVGAWATAPAPPAVSKGSRSFVACGFTIRCACGAAPARSRWTRRRAARR